MESYIRKQHNNLSELFTDICDELREKTNLSNEIIADDIPWEIHNLDTKGDAESDMIIENIVKKMTSNSSNNQVASGTNAYNTSFDFWRAFDGNTSNSYWATGEIELGDDQYLQFEADSIYGLKVIKLIGARASEPQGYLGDFKIIVSENGNSWTTVTSSLKAPKGKLVTFVLSKSIPFKYIRFIPTVYNINEKQVAITDIELWCAATVEKSDPESEPEIKPTVVTPIKLVSFMDGSDEQIMDMINGYYSNKLSIQDIKSVWNIGDYRTYEVVDEEGNSSNHCLIIIDFEHDTLASSVAGHTRALLTLMCSSSPRYGYGGTKNFISPKGYLKRMDSNFTSFVYLWEHSNIRNWCKTTFKDQLPTYIQTAIRNVVKPSISGVDITYTDLHDNNYYPNYTGHLTVPLDVRATGDVKFLQEDIFLPSVSECLTYEEQQLYFTIKYQYTGGKNQGNKRTPIVNEGYTYAGKTVFNNCYSGPEVGYYNQGVATRTLCCGIVSTKSIWLEYSGNMYVGDYVPSRMSQLAANQFTSLDTSPYKDSLIGLTIRIFNEFNLWDYPGLNSYDTFEEAFANAKIPYHIFPCFCL